MESSLNLCHLVEASALRTDYLVTLLGGDAEWAPIIISLLGVENPGLTSSLAIAERCSLRIQSNALVDSSWDG